MRSASRPSMLESVTIAVAMLLGFGALCHGFWQQDWSEVVSSLSVNLSRGYVWFLLGSAVTIILVPKVSRIGHAGVTVLLGALIAVFASGVWPLLAALGYFISCWSLGCLALKRYCRGHAVLDEATRVLVGAGLYGTLVGFAAHVQVNYFWVYLLMLAAPVALVREKLSAFLKTCCSILIGPTEKRSQAPLKALSGALMLTYFAFAFLPEIAHDPLAMHLFVPAYIDANHYWNFNPELYVWTLMPMLADWNFTIGYLLAGETCARLVNLGFLILGVCLVRDLVRALGGSRAGGGWAVLLLLSTPLAFLLGSALYVEAFWSAYLIAATGWMLKWVQGDRATSAPAPTLPAAASSSCLPLVGLLLGFSIAAKAVALLYVPICAVLVLARIRRLFSRGSGLLLVKAGVLFLAVGCVPYAVSYIVSGNPVFPFFNAVFESPYYSAVNFENPRFSSEIDWTLLYSMVFSSDGYIQGRLGGAGFQWVTLGLPVLAVLLFRMHRQAILLLAIAVLSLLAVFQFQTQLRYVYPVFLFTGALVGWALSDLRRTRRSLGGCLALVTGVTVAANLAFFGSAAERYFGVPVLEVFSSQGFSDLEERLAPGRQAVNLVNTVNGSRSPVAILATPCAAGLKADAIHANWYNSRFKDRILSARNSKAFIDVLREYGVRYLVYDSGWKANPHRMRRLVAESTDLIGSFGRVGVHAVKDRLFFQRELLASPGSFDGGQWSLRNGVRMLDGGAIAVSLNAPVMQAVAVEAGQTYLNSVTAQCGRGLGDGRVQVNWIDDADQFLQTDIRVFHCRDSWTVESQEVTAPSGAVFAIVYGTSHGDAEIELAEISFRTPIRWSPEISRNRLRLSPDSVQPESGLRER